MKRFGFGLALATLASLFYVYAEVEAVKIGYDIRKIEETKLQALDRGRALKYNIARLKAPHTLERRLQAQRIQLESPKQWQTLVMPGVRKSHAAVARPQVFGKLFMGTARAEAKESSR